MQDYQIMALSKIYAGYIRALGMQAENAIRESNGQSHAYGMEEFAAEASDVEYAGEQLR